MLLLLLREKKRPGRKRNIRQAVRKCSAEVVSAFLIPEKCRDKPITVQYSGRDREGDDIQYAFRWFIDDGIVQEGVNAVLEPGTYKKGENISVEILPSDKFGPGRPFRTSQVKVGNVAPVVTSVSLTPDDPPVGAIVAAVANGTDQDGDDIKYFYQWKVNGKAVTAPQEGNTFNTGGLRKKDIISVVVKATDLEAESKPVDSDIIVLSNSAPQIISSPPSNLDVV
jgi:hypothetical protein